MKGQRHKQGINDPLFYITKSKKEVFALASFLEITMQRIYCLDGKPNLGDSLPS